MNININVNIFKIYTVCAETCRHFEGQGLKWKKEHISFFFSKQNVKYIRDVRY